MTSIIGAKLSFSVLPDPVRNRPLFFASTAKAQEGSVLAQSYLDENRNGKRDFWEQPVQGVGFMLNRGYRPGLSNRHGKLLLSGLNSGGKVDIQLNPSTLGDPYLISSSEGYGITPRRRTHHAVRISADQHRRDRRSRLFAARR
ncbi:MAG: hypothetical protein Q9O24_06460 [Gammaproteobacteria bacterium]|nr:hypothetical protein [Gammaproteobacteria bacterium]